MKMMKKTGCLAIAAAAVLMSAPSMALEAEEWIVRFGATVVDPREDSDNVFSGDVDTGGSVGVDSDTQFGIAVEYMINTNWGLELLAASPFEHNIVGKGALSGIDIGEIKHLPPTLSLNYHIGRGWFQPYAGLGLNYTIFFDEDLDSEIETALGEKGDLELEDSFGFAAQVGADFILGSQWLINASIRYISIETEAEIDLDDGTKLDVDVDIDPWVYSLFVGYRF